MLPVPKIMSWQEWRQWLRERERDDGVMYDKPQNEESLYYQYCQYVTTRRHAMAMQAAPVKRSSVFPREPHEFTSLLAAIRDFFGMTALEAYAEWKTMTEQDKKDFYLALKHKEGYVNIVPKWATAGLFDPPARDLLSVPPSDDTPQLPAIIPASVNIIQHSKRPPDPLEAEIVVSEGYTVGDAHPTIELPRAMNS
jgi:hypothetical protein